MLAPCPGCARHVRVVERACPFCSAVLALAGTPPRASPTQRLGRGALFAFGASVASAMGCGQATTADVGTPDAVIGDAAVGVVDGASHDAIIGSFDAGYGAADVSFLEDVTPPDDVLAVDAASNDASTVFDPCGDVGVFLMYGGPPPPPCDAGPAPDASTADAGVDAWGAALYGAPPPPPEPQP